MKAAPRDSSAATCPLRAGGSEIHVWRFRLQADRFRVARYTQLLSTEETLRSTQFHFERDRRRFIVRRGVRRQILANYQNCEARTLRFTAGPFGKPALAGATGDERLCFSCSHSEEWGLVAVARGRELGLDVEMHRPWNSTAEAVAGFFSPFEREALSRLPPERRVQAFFDCWTGKEACVKALGAGLSYPLHQFTVPVTPGATPRLVRLEGDPTAGRRWTLTMLELGDNCSAALAAEGDAVTVRSDWWKPDLSPGS